MELRIEHKGGGDAFAALDKLTPPDRVRLHKFWGLRARERTQRNALAKGGRRFWASVADQVQLVQAGANGAHVAVDHVAAAQKQYGGTIVPKPGKKFLTIPIAEEAKGKRAAEFELGGRELFLLGDPENDQALLGYSDDATGFVPLYVLKKSVTQKPDPFLPTDDELVGVGMREAERLLGRL